MSQHQQLGWGVELTGHPVILDAWADRLAVPFEPWIERHTHNGRQITALRSSAISNAVDSQDARRIGKIELDHIKGAMAIESGPLAVPIDLGSSINVQPDGTIHECHFIEVHDAVIVTSMTAVQIVARDAHGVIFAPPPPARSRAQTVHAAAVQNPLISKMLAHAGRATDWYEMYKALEVAEDLVGGEKVLQQISGLSARRFKDLKQTINFERHSGKKHQPPKRPVPKGEATSLVLATANRTLNHLGI